MGLPLVDVRKPVHQLEPSLKAKLGDEAQCLIPSAHVELVQPQAIVNAFEIVVVVLPPFVEISVRELEDGGGERVPSLVEVNEQIYFVVLKLHCTDLDGIEQSRVEQFLFIEVNDRGEIEVKDQVAGFKTELAQDDLIPRQPVSDDKNAVDEHKPPRTVGDIAMHPPFLFCRVRRLECF